MIFLLKVISFLFNIYGVYILFIRMDRINSLPDYELSFTDKSNLFKNSRFLFLGFIVNLFISIGGFTFDFNMVEIGFSITSMLIASFLYIEYLGEVEKYSIKLRDNKVVREFFLKATVELNKNNRLFNDEQKTIGLNKKK